ncbi:kinase-like protein [Wallemia mellicola]|uniref:Kinase-like protein n=1 Tax=Wallemia mellicola TaxID=1708541 RepID=A0A4T0SZW8_9BASI|nr:kinase-like protein [Wallemia mellicola]TIC57989.1 kinase-like protein [Wallemia mellicola]TIC67268.1 kinase-like protein [Wallemia mellicola]
MNKSPESVYLSPYVNMRQQSFTRAPPDGVSLPPSYTNPTTSLTLELSQLYNKCNNLYSYKPSNNPRRVLTKPSKPVHNQGYDNQDNDYILYVNDWLGGGSSGTNNYLIIDILGQGTFGQVAKCQNVATGEIVAIKVIKNKPAYFNQSMMEVTILELLNNQFDNQDNHHILRLMDQFIHCKHLCLVFELLSSNLYELIKQNSFRGLSTSLVKVFTSQLLDALVILNQARLIHCDLKPENILLKSLQSPQIKIIDFGSACHERQTVYTYIQSRFYRSPEVLLGMPYSSAIDMWSLGCIAVELFLGLPLFPGTSEYNQITRIVDMLGLPPSFMLQSGKQSHEFFETYLDEFGKSQFRLKSLEKYSQEHNTQEQPSKKYFSASTLPEIIKQYPVSSSKAKSESDLKKEQSNRLSFIHFVQGLLNMNPIERWSPQQARLHPFITGEQFTGSWTPPNLPSGNKSGSPSGSTLHASSNNPMSPSSSQIQHFATGTPTAPPAVAPASVPPTPTDQVRPYGGLQASSKSPSRPYQNAQAYNQQLAQQSNYLGQQASAQIAAANAYRNPFPPPPPPATNKAQPPLPGGAAAYSSPRYQKQNVYPVNYQTTMPPPPPPPQTKQWGNSGMDIIPPQLAKIAAMSSHENLGRGSSMTPIINRDEAMREWERRNTSGGSAMMSGGGHQKRNSWQQYPQLEFLQEQAERAASQSYMNQARGYIPQQAAPPPPASSNLNVVIDPNTNLQRQQYNYNAGTPIDAYGSNDGMGTLYVPLVPPQSTMNAYQSQPPTPSKNFQSPNSAYMIPPPAAAAPPNNLIPKAAFPTAALGRGINQNEFNKPL